MRKNWERRVGLTRATLEAAHGLAVRDPTELGIQTPSVDALSGLQRTR